MPVMPMTGMAIGVGSEHAEDAMRALDDDPLDEALSVVYNRNK